MSGGGVPMEWVAALLAVAVVGLLAVVLRLGKARSEGGRLPTMAERIEDVETRMDKVETVLASLPTRDALHKVSLQVAHVEGVSKSTAEKVERMGDKIEASTRALERVESYLMVAATDALVKARPVRAARQEGARQEGARPERHEEARRQEEETR